MDGESLDFYRLTCGCVVLMASENGVSLMRRIADAPDCHDVPADDRFHCWRPSGAVLDRSVQITEIVSARLQLGTRDYPKNK